MYTGNGDGGTTTLFGSRTRLSKHNEIFEALGSIDELNACLGLCKVAADTNKELVTTLHTMQEHLFIIQAELGAAKHRLNQQNILWCESIIKTIEEQLPPITTFLIPGGTELSARLDHARTVARRAERSVIHAHEANPVDKYTLAYLNRASSVLYALTRLANHQDSATEQAPQYDTANTRHPA